MNKSNTIFTLIFALAIAWMVRSLFPIREEVVIRQPPVTIHDTVKVIDTAWVTKLKRQTDTLWLQRFSVTPPETIFVRSPITGIKAVLVGKDPGDTTYALGYRLIPDTASNNMFINQPWLARWVTPGPLKGIVVDDSIPPKAVFYPAPKPRHDCGFFCKASHYLVGGVGGYAACKVVN